MNLFKNSCSIFIVFFMCFKNILFGIYFDFINCQIEYCYFQGVSLIFKVRNDEFPKNFCNKLGGGGKFVAIDETKGSD